MWCVLGPRHPQVGCISLSTQSSLGTFQSLTKEINILSISIDFKVTSLEQEINPMSVGCQSRCYSAPDLPLLWRERQGSRKEYTHSPQATTWWQSL